MTVMYCCALFTLLSNRSVVLCCQEFISVGGEVEGTNPWVGVFRLVVFSVFKTLSLNS